LICFGFVLLVLLLAGSNRKTYSAELRHTKKPSFAEQSRLGKQPNASISLDSDNDGIPDAAELQSFNDRENLSPTLRFQLHQAGMQFYHFEKHIGRRARDSAGLVRCLAQLFASAYVFPIGVRIKRCVNTNSRAASGAKLLAGR